MSPQEIKSRVQDELEGMTERQKRREEIRLILRLRRTGILESVYSTRMELKDRHVEYAERQVWGITVLALMITGLELVYDRTGLINYNRRRRRPPLVDTQEPLFSDDVCGPCSSPSAAR